MRGRWFACLVLVVLLSPLATADHKDKHRPLIDIDLGDDDEDDDRGDGDQDDDRGDDGRDDRVRRQGDGPRPPGDDRGASDAPSHCLEATGGATEKGNVVAWSENAGAVDVHRRAGEGAWEHVHQAEPDEAMFIDHDLTKGDTYAYRVVADGEPADDCPYLEMTAVPFFPDEVWIGAGSGVAGALGVWMFARHGRRAAEGEAPCVDDGGPARPR